jgi:hypothetical protein
MWQLSLARGPSFPRMINVKPVTLQNHQSLGHEHLAINLDRQSRFLPNGITRTASQIVLHHEGVYFPLVQVSDVVRINGLTWCNGRVGLIVMLTGSRHLKTAFIDKLVGIGAKLGSVSELLNQRTMSEFVGKLLGLGSRIAYVSLLIELFSCTHEGLAADAQVPRCSFLQFNSIQRHGSPLILGSPLQRLHHGDRTRLQAVIVEDKCKQLIKKSPAFPREMDRSIDVVAVLRNARILCCDRSIGLKR